MLISTNKSDKSNSKYKCDMCKNFLSPLNRYNILVAEGYANPRKKWDLCSNCFRILNKNIENWEQRKKKNITKKS